MRLTRSELCLIQQALGLRESTIVNANELTCHNPHLMETKLLRAKVIRFIGDPSNFISRPLPKVTHCICHRSIQEAKSNRGMTNCKRCGKLR